jgi:HK97 family phage portal protein
MMGLASRLYKPKALKNLAINDEKAWNPSLWRLWGSESVSGETVTEETALTYSAVWNAVSLIAGTVSCLPLHLLREDNKKTVRATEKSLFRVLHSQFNPYMTAQVGRETIAAHILTWGNCYCEKQRNGYGEIVALWPIPPNRCTPEMKNGELVYRINVDGEIIYLGRDKILHVPGLGFDGFQGYSVIAMARKSIGLSMAMETFGSLLFSNGMHPGAVISHPGVVKNYDNLRSAMNETYAGLGKSHKLMLLEEGMKFEKVGIPPEDSQFLGSRQFQVPEIARWFNLPPHKLKDLTRSSFNNIESEQISFVTDSILPWLIRFEQNFDMQLLNDNEKMRQGLYFRHNVDGLLRGNAKDRANYYKIMWGIGAMTHNEIRGKENWDPSPNPYADELFVPINNMIPISKIDEFLAKQSPKSREVQPNDNQ